MRGARAMGLHAALRAAHHQGCFCHIQSFPVTQQKGLALTGRQQRHRAFDQLRDFLARIPFLRIGAGVVGGNVQQLQRIGRFVFMAHRHQRRQQGAEESSHLAAAEVVADGVLQNALEEQRQFGGGRVGIAVGQLHHGVLHDVERVLLVPHGVQGLLEGAFLRRQEEVGHFLAACHRECFGLMPTQDGSRAATARPPRENPCFTLA